ncbi:hypothetical protein LBMAG27_00080 [Bacteroidota bacterium]|nr:hypothetical protein LBMAG27_00080 [Bacteroidota bacterium]
MINSFKLIAIIFCIAISAHISAQVTFEKTEFHFPLKTVVNPKSISTDWNPSLQNLEMPSVESDMIEMKSAKYEADKIYSKNTFISEKKENARTNIDAPFIARNFIGNVFNGYVPNDNDLAISNGNKIVNVINSTIKFYDLDLDTAYTTISLFAFCNSLGLPNEHFDPKVMYDPEADRFIMACLNGFTDSTSYYVIGFSQTNDPMQSWNFYTLPGNPFDDTLWTDFPMMSISHEELFLTGNLLHNNQPWQTGFVETFIWQINKWDGYNGDTLSSGIYHNINFNNKPIRNLCPVKGGTGPYGPNQYFLSNRNFAVSSDTVFLVELTDTLNAASTTIDILLVHSDVNYHVPPDAHQASFQFLATNDGRILGAFYQNNKIQFVSNSRDTVSNLAAIFHGVMNNILSNPSVAGYTISNDTLEYGYANLSYAGVSVTDNTAIIGFDYTDLNVKAGAAAIVSDGNGSYSSFTKIRSGDNYINVLSGTLERWGDYSGSQLKYNQPGVVWVELTYGAANKRQATWIAELSNAPFAGIKNKDKMHKTINLYPNPSDDVVNYEFEVEKEMQLAFEIIDMKGKIVQLLFKERVKEGKNKFSFNSSFLPSGQYLLLVKGENNFLQSKKFLKY